MFTDAHLDAIGAWQRGWGEDQLLRVRLGQRLQQVAGDLPDKFRSVSGMCFRKRYLHQSDMVPLIVENELHEGIASWTCDRAYAEKFKGIYRADAVSAGVFRCTPTPDQIVMNINALWSDDEFRKALDDYEKRNGSEAIALRNFADHQGEVVLNSVLRASELVGLSGIPSDFDGLCDQAGIHDEEERNRLFGAMARNGVFVNEPRLVSDDAVQAIIIRTIERLRQRILEVTASSAKMLTPISKAHELS